MGNLFTGSTALVTGASRGIGAALAGLLADRGANVVLVARGREDLEATAARIRLSGAEAQTIVADLSDPAAPAEIERRIKAAGLQIDHLVNNAGIGVHGYFAEAQVEEHLRVIDVNARAATELAARFLPGMLARRQGGILNIASTAAFQGLAWLPVYSATKAYLLTWSEAVWASLRGTGVRCCCVLPGPVDTPFFERNDLTTHPPGFLMQSAETVARRGLRAYARDRCVSITSPLFRCLAWSTRLAPRALAALGGTWYARRK